VTWGGGGGVEMSEGTSEYGYHRMHYLVISLCLIRSIWGVINFLMRI
jgi:hypothetical protein